MVNTWRYILLDKYEKVRNYHLDKSITQHELQVLYSQHDGISRSVHWLGLLCYRIITTGRRLIQLRQFSLDIEKINN